MATTWSAHQPSDTAVVCPPPARRPANHLRCLHPGQDLHRAGDGLRLRGPIQPSS